MAGDGGGGEDAAVTKAGLQAANAATSQRRRNPPCSRASHQHSAGPADAGEQRACRRRLPGEGGRATGRYAAAHVRIAPGHLSGRPVALAVRTSRAAVMKASGAATSVVRTSRAAVMKASGAAQAAGLRRCDSHVAPLEATWAEWTHTD